MSPEPGLLARSRHHLGETQLSYVGHMRVAFEIGARMLVAGLACLVHGVVPGACTDTASRTVRRLHAGLQARAHQPPPTTAASPRAASAEAEA